MKTLINQQKTGKCIIAKNEWKLLEGNADYYGSLIKHSNTKHFVAWY